MVQIHWQLSGITILREDLDSNAFTSSTRLVTPNSGREVTVIQTNHTGQLGCPYVFEWTFGVS